LAVLQFGRNLDERRAIGLRIDAQCVDGLRVFVGVAPQLGATADQERQRWIGFRSLNLGALLATYAASAAAHDRFCE
jgi:hypothetical protein